jgi:monoamine oxidase
MARSALMLALKRILRANRAARARGVPLDEYLHMRAEAGVSRRRFLEASAVGAGFATAAGASALVGCSGDDNNPPLPATDAGATDATLDGMTSSDAPSGSDTSPSDAGHDASDSAPVPDANVSAQIVIVGGGIAGTHCAYRLKKDYGVKALLFEANANLGGRTKSDRTTFPDGMHVELGGEFIDTDQQIMFSLQQELGLPTLVNFSNLVDQDGGLVDPYLAVGLGNLYFGGKLFDSAAFFAQFQPIADAINDAWSVLHDPSVAPNYMSANGGQALDQMSIAQWIDKYNLSGPAVEALTVAYVTEFGLDPASNNVINLLYSLYPATGPVDEGGVLGDLLPDGGGYSGFSIFGVSDQLYTTQGGNQSYVEAMAAALDASQVTTGAVLTKLVETSGGQYVLTFQSGASTFTVTADHVVLALPFSALRAVDLSGIAFPAVKMQAINELGYGQNTKLMCGFSSKPWRSLNSEGLSFNDLPFQSSWETSRLQPSSSGAGILTAYLGGTSAVNAGNPTPQELYTSFLPQFDQVFPSTPKPSSVANNVMLRAYWPGNPYTKGSYSAYLPGQYTTISGAENQRYKNVHFCGEHCSTGTGYNGYTDFFQGFMAGGAGTGAAVAMEVASDLGLLGMLEPRRLPRRGLFVPGAAAPTRFG